MTANTVENVTNIRDLSINLLGIIRMGAKALESEEVVGEETLTGASGSVRGTVKTRTLKQSQGCGTRNTSRVAH